MIQLQNTNADQSSISLRVPAGIYKHLYLVVEGTNTATAVTAGDLGTIQLVKNGYPIINCDTLMAMHIGNMFGGRVMFSSTASGSCYFTVPLFMYDPPYPGNVLHVADSDACFINVQWGANFTTRLSTGEARICADPASGVQAYNLLYRQQQFPITGAGTLNVSIDGENFLRAFIHDMSDTDISRVTLIVDDRVMHDCSRLEGIMGSNFSCRIEDQGSAQQIATGYVTADTVAHFPFCVNGRINEMLSDNLRLMVQAGGSATVTIVTLQADFTPDRQRITQDAARVELRRILRMKASKGKGRAVTVVRQAELIESGAAS